MSFSIETLQDFVLNLINDEAAKAAYLADPLAALREAGLADLTPADVQEVLPLVADSLPAGVPDLGDLPHGLPGLPELGDLPHGLPGLPDLGDLPHDLPELPELGDLPVDLPGVPDLGDLPHGLPGLPGLGDLPHGLPELGDLPVEIPSLPVDLPSVPTVETPLGDITAVAGHSAAALDLDGDLIDSVTAGTVTMPGDCDDDTSVAHATETPLGSLVGAANLGGEDLSGSLAGTSAVADASFGFTKADGTATGWGEVETFAGDLGAGVLATHEGAAVAAESPLGHVEVNSYGEFSIAPADTADLLDVDHLGHTGDAVAGTVAHYATAGAGALSDVVDRNAGDLAGFLTGTPGPLAEVVDHGGQAVSDGIEHAGDAVADHVTDLPVQDLPVDHLPELPQLPDLPDIDSGDLPQLPDVSDHLPLDVPSLPVDLPDTGAVTDLVSDNPVTDAVHSSPVGGLVDGVTGHLPQVVDLPGDLDLGL